MNRSRTLLNLACALALVLLSNCSAGTSVVTAPTGTARPITAGYSGVVLNDDLTGLRVFPDNDPWNLDASNAPVDPLSNFYINWIKRSVTQDSTTPPVRLQAYFGPSPLGIPYVAVSGTQALLPVDFTSFPKESDTGAPGRPPGYPIPDVVRGQPGYIEGGKRGDLPPANTYGDRHMIVVDRDHGMLFETWATLYNAQANRWEAGSGATFDLATGASRPDGWTSADAAGLPIFPGLVRYDEVYGSGEIRHAFRCNTWATDGHVWPASHTAGGTIGAPPLGTRLRLKASVDLSGYPAEMQRIFRAMKTHGLIVADNGGSAFAVTGTMDERWDMGVVVPAFESLRPDDFEVVQLGWGRPSATPR
jgi:hypothetical protein